MTFWRRPDDCAHIRDKLSAYIDSHVSTPDHQIIDRHLQSCAKCAAHFSGLQATVAALRSMPVIPVPRNFTVSLPAEHRTPLPTVYFYFRNASAALAALLMLVFAFGYVQQASLVSAPAKLSAPQVLSVPAAGGAAKPAEGPVASVAAQPASPATGNTADTRVQAPAPQAAPAAAAPAAQPVSPATAPAAAQPAQETSQAPAAKGSPSEPQPNRGADQAENHAYEQNAKTAMARPAKSFQLVEIILATALLISGLAAVLLRFRSTPRRQFKL